MIKEPAYYSHSIFSFTTDSNATKFLFSLFEQKNTWETHLSYRKGPPFHFLKLFKRSLQNRPRRGPSFNCFHAVGLDYLIYFFFFKGTPLILLKFPLVISGVKRYIRTFDVISELYCVSVRRRRRFENRSFSSKRPTHISKTALFQP